MDRPPHAVLITSSLAADRLRFLVSRLRRRRCRHRGRAASSDPTDRVLVIVPPISAFVATGFEHSIASMYCVPLAILVRDFDPAFVAARGLEAKADALRWTAFLWSLVPVTVGNLIGGTALVAAVYWFVYLRGRPSK